MSTYVYHCPRCGEFEVEQRVTDAPLQTCPRQSLYAQRGGGTALEACGEPVKRLIAGSTTFALKGAGWAKDGYR